MRGFCRGEQWPMTGRCGIAQGATQSCPEKFAFDSERELVLSHLGIEFSGTACLLCCRPCLRHWSLCRRQRPPHPPLRGTFSPAARGRREKEGRRACSRNERAGPMQ
jgi:hypothetical protein